MAGGLVYVLSRCPERIVLQVRALLEGAGYQVALSGRRRKTGLAAYGPELPPDLSARVRALVDEEPAP